MQIRTRLTIQFLLIVAVILMLASVTIYLSSAGYRKEDFYSRLLNKGNINARLLIEVDEVDAALLRKIEKDNPVSLPKEKITIYDYRNQILYTSDDENTIKINSELLDEIRLKGEMRFKQGEFEVLGFLFTAKYDRFVVIASASDIYGIKKLHNLRNILMLVSTSSLLLSLISGWFYSGRALMPIAKVINQVDEITISSISNRVDRGNGKDEIAMLAHTFNKMLERLETAFKAQKNFIANASHELRNPLTSITGQLEVLLMKDRENSEYLQAIKSVLDDMRGLNQLSNRLLILAQVSSDASESDFQHVRIDDIIWLARDEIVKRNANYIIHIRLSEDIDDESKIIINGDEQLIKTAVINLMDNGCKYSENHTVGVLFEPEQTRLNIIFSDEGIGIDKEDLVEIFKPFYRGRNVRKIKGHGLGLSLVEKIVTMHQGNITIQSELNKGTTIKISLPYST